MADASEFTPTKFDSADDKAHFVKHFVRFVEQDFPEPLFTEGFYERLSRTFGHIAHCDRAGFYNTWFINTRSKVGFLRRTLSHPCYGDPHWTYSDAEQSIQRALQAGNVVAKYELQLRCEVEQYERGLLKKLKEKYEPATGTAPKNSIHSTPAETVGSDTQLPLLP